MRSTNSMTDEKILAAVDPEGPAPEDGELRQYYFLRKMQEFTAGRAKTLERKMTACVVTFGCQMNFNDSEKLTGILKTAGFDITENEDADFVIFNTCTVRENANEHLYGRLGEVHHLKKSDPRKVVAICGCMVQEKSATEKIKKSYPFVNLIFGTYNLYCFPEYLYRCYHGEKHICELWDKSSEIVENMPVLRKYPWKSGVNIMFGCDNFCSYCIVPYVRGREKSREPKEILREIEKLADDGVKEIMLLGQNVNSYGKNLPEKTNFAELLAAAAQIPGIERIRFMTPHPKDFSDDVLYVIRDNPKIARHIHLPLQSGSDRILQAMNRHYTKESFLELVDHIRSIVPDAAITTDIIIGFPGETAADADETIDVVKKAHFDNAFTFIYSPRVGTPAARMEQVPEEEKKQNFDRLLSVVQETAKEQAKKLQGREFTALIEEMNDQDTSFVTGRLSNNMIVHVKGDSSMIGRFYRVRLDDCRGFYYFGTALGEMTGPDVEVR